MKLLNKKQVAEMLGMSTRSLEVFRMEGHPLLTEKAIMHMGTQLRWRDTDVNEYIASLEYEAA